MMDWLRSSEEIRLSLGDVFQPVSRSLRSGAASFWKTAWARFVFRPLRLRAPLTGAEWRDVRGGAQCLCCLCFCELSWLSWRHTVPGLNGSRSTSLETAQLHS